MPCSGSSTTAPSSLVRTSSSRPVIWVLRVFAPSAAGDRPSRTGRPVQPQPSARDRVFAPDERLASRRRAPCSWTALGVRPVHIPARWRKLGRHMETLAEDLYLLACDEATGRSRIPAAYLDLGLGGAVLLDLARRGRVALVD